MTAAVLKAKTHIDKLDIGLSDKDKKSISEGLSTALADTYLLLVKTHVYHWNVVGPLFKPLHELLEEHYKDLFAAADVIAERIRALGYPAPLSFADLMSRTRVNEEDKLRSADGIVHQLLADHERIVQRMRDLAAAADEAKDFATNDLMTQRLATHEKAIWMLSAIISD